MNMQNCTMLKPRISHTFIKRICTISTPRTTGFSDVRCNSMTKRNVKADILDNLDSGEPLAPYMNPTYNEYSERESWNTDSATSPGTSSGDWTPSSSSQDETPQNSATIAPASDGASRSLEPQQPEIDPSSQDQPASSTSSPDAAQPPYPYDPNMAFYASDWGQQEPITDWGESGWDSSWDSTTSGSDEASWSGAAGSRRMGNGPMQPGADPMAGQSMDDPSASGREFFASGYQQHNNTGQYNQSYEYIPSDITVLSKSEMVRTLAGIHNTAIAVASVVVVITDMHSSAPCALHSAAH